MESKPYTNQPELVKFIQIAGVDNELYALDEDGVVWKYFPAKPEIRNSCGGIAVKGRFAFWGKLTQHRAK